MVGDSRGRVDSHKTAAQRALFRASRLVDVAGCQVIVVLYFKQIGIHCLNMDLAMC